MKDRVRLYYDTDGKPKTVEMSYAQYKKLMDRIRKYEQAMKIKEDLQVAFDEVRDLEKTGRKPKNLKDFLHEI
jgi:hypothetical protein